MRRVEIESIIDALEKIKETPNRFVITRCPEVVSFVEGFTIGCTIFGYSRDFEAYKQAVTGRGWEFSSAGIWIEMEEKGYDTEAIMQEFLSIYIDMWKIQQKKADGEK